MNHEYAIETITPPASEPVTLAEMKTHLRLNTTAEDSLLTGIIKAAREKFEALTGRVCQTTTFRQYLPKFCGPVPLVNAPVTSVISVKYYDQGDTLTEVESFEADLVSCPAWVWLTAGYPSLSPNKRPVAYVEYVAGWTTVPEMVKQAVKLLAAHFFKNREAYTSTSFELRDLPMGFRSVTDQFQTGVVGYANW